MSTDTSSSTWWDKYRETVNVTKYYRQLISLLNNRQDIAQKMINLEKCRYPGKSESWYLTKIVDKLRSVNN